MIPLRVACIGRHGQVAQAIAAAAAGYPSIELHQAGRDGADLTDPMAVEAFILQSRAHLVINAGSYNFVDRAESEEAVAFAVNAEGPRMLARLCRRHGVQLIHMSTDCVFDGAGNEPHDEDETPRPLSAYGRSKLAGEMAVADNRKSVV